MLTTEFFLLGFIVLFAGIVRGCIGFGFSALVVVSGTLFIAPSTIVPMVVILEIVASLHMAAGTWRQVAMKPLVYLLIGAAIATPLGVMALVALPAQDIRLLLSGLILLMSLLLLSGWQYTGRINIFSYFFMGLFSGVCNGAAAVGGLPVAVFLASMRLSMTQLRATLVLFFLATEVVFIVSALGHNLYNKPLLIQITMMIIPMVLGIHYGSKLFHKLNEKILRRAVIALLLVLSSVGLVKGLIA